MFLHCEHPPGRDACCKSHAVSEGFHLQPVSATLVTSAKMCVTSTTAPALWAFSCQSWPCESPAVSGVVFCCVQIGLEMLISHPGNDPSTWAITQIFYNGQVYQNTTQLNTAFADTTSGLNRQQVTAALPVCPC